MFSDSKTLLIATSAFCAGLMLIALCTILLQSPQSRAAFFVSRADAALKAGNIPSDAETLMAQAVAAHPAEAALWIRLAHIRALREGNCGPDCRDALEIASRLHKNM